MATYPRPLAEHVDRYLSSLPRTYTEEQHGEAIRRVATEITRRAHARYSELAARFALAAFVSGAIVGWAIGGLL